MKFFLLFILLWLVSSSFFAEAKTVSLVESVDTNNEMLKTVSFSNSFEVIVRFSDKSIHNDLIMTPETKSIQKTLSRNKLKTLNVDKMSTRKEGLAVLESVFQSTGILLVHKRSLSLGFDLFTVKTNISKLSGVIDALKLTGHFNSVRENKKLTHPTPQNASSASISSHGSQTVFPAQFDLNQYDDTGFASQVYLDKKTGLVQGNNDLLRASQYAHDMKAIEKVRIAVIDTGYFPNEDIVYAQDEADFVSSDTYSDCADIDSTNNGADVVCSSDSYIAKTRDRDATDKGWYFTKTDGEVVSDGEICISGHGTEVATALAATRNNGVGLVGALDHRDVEVIPVRAMNCDGGLPSDIADAIVWSAGGDVPGMENISRKVDIINLSLGGGSRACSEGEVYKEAVDFAISQGVAVVAAVGNDSRDMEDFQPANCAGVIAVGSNNPIGELSSFSNYGDLVDITLSGEEISAGYMSSNAYKSSEWSMCRIPTDKSTCYGQFSGTSLAAPLASALAGMIKLINPQAAPHEIRGMMMAASDFSYTTDIWGDEALRTTMVPNAGIGNAYDTLTIPVEESTDLDSIEVENLFGHYTSDYENEYLSSLVSLAGKDNVCNSYSIRWKSYVYDLSNDEYVIYGSNSNSQMNENNSTILFRVGVKEAVVNLSGYTKLGIQINYNGSSGEIIEVDLSGTARPPVCAS